MINMATAEEILATMAEDTSEYEEVCLIDTDARTISIPNKLKIVGVESDEDVVRRTFRMPWQFGENDLSTFAIRINYLNAQGEGDKYTVEDMAKSGDDMTFSWLLSRNATKYKGNIRFVVCMILSDGSEIDKEWNTTLAEFTVLEGLETSGQIEEENPDAIESILLRLTRLEQTGGTGGATINDTTPSTTTTYSGSKIEEIAKTKVGTTELNTAVENALTEAKKSGEFDGEPGAKGDPGDDGYTPVKGTDYWTEADKTEIVNDVLAALPTWEGGTY